MTGALRFARRLLVVCIATTVVIGLGFAWRASPAAGLVADGGGRRPPGGVDRAAAFPARGQAGRFDGGSRDDEGLALSHVDDVVQTLLIEVAVLAAIVVIDRTRRRRRPVRPSGV